MRLVRTTYRFFRNCLSGILNRQFLIFLFFLGLSTAFWFILTLDQEYEFEVTIPVRLVDVPNNVIITTDLPKEVHVTLKDKGVAMLRYKYGAVLKPISFSFKNYASRSGHSVIPNTDLLKQVATQLMAGTRLVAARPDPLEFYFNNGSCKRVPVRLAGVVKPDELFYISSISIRPQYVTVYASQAILDTLTAVYVEPVNYRNLSDTVRTTRRIRPIKGAKIMPSRASIVIRVDQMTEKTVSVPVQWVNFPATKVLRTFPAKVDVTFQVGASEYKYITADNFVIVVNYDQVQNNKTNQCTLSLKTIPRGVSNVRISPSTVDYVIEDAPEN